MLWSFLTILQFCKVQSVFLSEEGPLLFWLLLGFLPFIYYMLGSKNIGCNCEDRWPKFFFIYMIIALLDFLMSLKVVEQRTLVVAVHSVSVVSAHPLKFTLTSHRGLWGLLRYERRQSETVGKCAGKVTSVFKISPSSFIWCYGAAVKTWRLEWFTQGKHHIV